VSWRRWLGPLALCAALCVGALAVKLRWERSLEPAPITAEVAGGGRSWWVEPDPRAAEAEARFGAARHGLRALSWAALLCWLCAAGWWVVGGHDADGEATGRRGAAASVTVVSLALWLWLSWMF
jgi:hypothetical protein